MRQQIILETGTVAQPPASSLPGIHCYEVLFYG